MSAFDAMRRHSQTMQASFAAPNPMALQGIYQQQMAMVEQLGSSPLAQMAQAAVSKLHDFAFGETARRLEALRNKASALFDEDRISLIDDIGTIQQAPASMIPYIMAIPEVYEMYMNEELEGYGDDFIDIQPGAIGVDSFNYRTMTSGIVQQVEGEKGPYSSSTTFFELHQSDNPLSVQARMNIDVTRKAVLAMLEGERDPTSPWNNLL